MNREFAADRNALFLVCIFRERFKFDTVMYRRERRMTLDNIVLIGMPGCGKSTVGVLLAKAMGLDFVDTDVVFQAREQRRLQEMIDDIGIDAFLEKEEEAIVSKLHLLDVRFLDTPGLAIEQCQNVAFEMSEITKKALFEATTLLNGYDEEKAQKIFEKRG